MRLLAIFGPTAVGKTAVAIAVAEMLRAGGEDPVAISCDSIQVYRGLEVLSGAAPKPSASSSSTASSPSSTSARNTAPGRFAEEAQPLIDGLLDRGQAADPRRRHRPLPPRRGQRARAAAHRLIRRSALPSRRGRERGPGGAARGDRAGRSRRHRPRRPHPHPARDRAPAGGHRPRPPTTGRRALDRPPAAPDAARRPDDRTRGARPPDLRARRPDAGRGGGGGGRGRGRRRRIAHRPRGAGFRRSARGRRGAGRRPPTGASPGASSPGCGGWRV